MSRKHIITIVLTVTIQSCFMSYGQIAAVLTLHMVGSRLFKWEFVHLKKFISSHVVRVCPINRLWAVGQVGMGRQLNIIF